jgi:hypothetical protein
MSKTLVPPSWPGGLPKGITSCGLSRISASIWPVPVSFAAERDSASHNPILNFTLRGLAPLRHG